MNNNIISKIEKIEKLLKAIKKEISELDVPEIHDSEWEHSASSNNDDYQAEFEFLYQEYLSGHQNSISEYVFNHTKPQLQSFCKDNNLPIEVTKTSKADIIRMIHQWMNQRKIITT